MLHSDWIGFALFIGYFIIAGAPLILLKAVFNLPFEITRKMYHLLITLSIFPLLKLFSGWYVAVLVAITFALILYPILAWVEHSSLYQKIAVERGRGEFKRSLIIVQVSLASLIFIFWGLLGDAWQYIAVVAVMAWGFGDAAAALVGKKFGQRAIQNRHIEGRKTVEGTLAMFVVSGLAVFFTLLLYADQSWQISLPVALLVAPICAGVELFSIRGMDTITVPISAGITTLTLMMLFTRIGGLL